MMHFKLNAVKPYLPLIIGALLVAVVGLWAVSGAAARTLASPSVEYSADFEISASGEEVSGKAWYADGNERREMVVPEGGKKEQVTIILRLDQGLMYMTSPQARGMTMSMPFDTKYRMTADQAVAGMDFPSEGSETISGEKTSKLRIDKRTLMGETFDGYIWVTNDNIIMKMDGVSTSDGETHKVHLLLSNVKRGKLDTDLFEPKGQIMSMGGMMNSFGKGVSPF